MSQPAGDGHPVMWLTAIRNSWEAAKADNPDLTVWGFIKLFFASFSRPE
jgi:hypothetical protein